MSPRTLLILTILVALLGAFIFFFEQETLSTDERAAQAKKVLTVEKDDVRAVAIAWDGSEVRLERQEPAEPQDGEDENAFGAPEGEWRLAAPFSARADAAAVGGLLTSLTGLEKERTIEDADRAALGLDEPRARVTLTTDDGGTVLEIGHEIPASSDMVVGVAGRGDAYQVATTVWGDLTREPGDWRDKKLFTASRADIERLTLSTGDSRVLLAQRGDDFWIESPLADLADEDLVNGLMTQVTGLSAAAFVDGPEAGAAALGLEPPAHVLEIGLAGREEHFRVELGNVKDGGGEEAADGAPASTSQTLYARAGGQVVEIETRLADSFAKTPAEWRSRQWTPTQVFRVESARFEDAGGTVEVTRDGSDWSRGEDRVAYSTVSDVLYAVAEAKAEEVLERAAAEARGYRLEEPALAVTLDTEDTSESLALYPAVDGMSAATREGREAVLLLSSDAVEEVTSKLAALRVAEPLPEEDEEEGDEEPE